VTCEDQYEIDGQETVECVNGTWRDIGTCKPSCLPHQCHFHGVCIEPGKCQCQSGYKGDECELNDCPDVNQCSNNGVCVSTNVCLCNKGWDGPRCDLSIRELNDVAMYLTGDGEQQIQIPTLGSYNKTSIEFWMFPEFVLGRQFIYDATNKSVFGQLSFGLMNDKLFVQIKPVGVISFDHKFFGGVWTHVALVVDVIGSSIILYVNGAQVDKKSIPDCPLIFFTPHRLGGYQPYYYKGYVKELRFWKTIRSAQQISDNTFLSLTGIDKQLIALYPLSGPLSANNFYIEDLTGGNGSRVLNAIWKRAPFAPPSFPNLLPKELSSS